ncbi:MAG: hypothetical protein GY754_38700 [bacterium]|nr:hypothetical protein [bacterium]
MNIIKLIIISLCIYGLSGCGVVGGEDYTYQKGGMKRNPGKGVMEIHGGFTIDRGSLYTWRSKVTLRIDVKRAANMRFSLDNEFWTSWEHYSEKKTLKLDPGHSSKRIYGEFKGLGNNVLKAADIIFPLREEKFTEPGDYENNYFGSGVALSADGKTLAAGAHGEEGFRQSVYIFALDQEKPERPDPKELEAKKKEKEDRKKGIKKKKKKKKKKKSDDDEKKEEPEPKETKIKPRIIRSPGVIRKEFGSRIALSADGKTLAVGVYNDNIDERISQGAVLIYDLSDPDPVPTPWLITSPDGQAMDYLGWDVALSANGKVLAASCYYREKVYLFRLHKKRYTTSIVKAPGKDFFGNRVSLSADGETLMVSGYKKNKDKAIAYLYHKDNRYSRPQVIKTPKGIKTDSTGYAVSLSANGATAAIAALSGKQVRKAVYIYKTWFRTPHARVVTVPDGLYDDYWGYDISLSGNGSTLVTGSAYTGSIYIVRLNDQSMDPEIIPLPNKGYPGFIVSVSSDGSTIAAGTSSKKIAPPGDSPKGAVFVY